MWYENEYDYWDADQQKRVDAKGSYTKHDLPGLIIHRDSGLVIDRNYLGEFEKSALFKLMNNELAISAKLDYNNPYNQGGDPHPGGAYY